MTEIEQKKHDTLDRWLKRTVLNNTLLKEPLTKDKITEEGLELKNYCFQIYWLEKNGVQIGEEIRFNV